MDKCRKLLFFDPLNIFITSIIAILFCYITNLIFSKIFKAPTNIESVFITALIITLIIPVYSQNVYVIAAIVSFFAMASKYLITIDKRHIINPAIAGLVITSLIFDESVARWWIGNNFMFENIC